MSRPIEPPVQLPHLGNAGMGVHRAGGHCSVSSEILRAPFPWWGGKSRAAPLIWPRFGEPVNYIEPFAGSLAVLLARPNKPQIETVNDLDCFLANFWRAVAADPEQVADFADWPVNEADLHARHRWLVNQVEFRERMRSDPEYFDAKVAGWWCWGICAWIGSGWCSAAPGEDTGERLPMMGGSGDEERGNAHPGRGVHSKAMRGESRESPALGADSGAAYGRGIHQKGMSEKLPLLGGTKGTGVHQRSALPEQLPRLGAGGDGVRPAPTVGNGVHSYAMRSRIHEVFEQLHRRLRGVRVACGDFERVLSDSVTWRHGTTAILLDPEYPDGADVYAHSDKATGEEHIWHRAARWAVEHGKDERLRIALCGYAGTWTPPDGWEEIAWKAKGSYGGQRKKGAPNDNAARERIWFSPGCLKPGETTAGQRSLLDV